MYFGFVFTMLLGCRTDVPSAVVESETIEVANSTSSKKKPKKIKREGSFIFDPINHQMMARMQEG